jgi:hypothetical protein
LGDNSFFSITIFLMDSFFVNICSIIPGLDRFYLALLPSLARGDYLETGLFPNLAEAGFLSGVVLIGELFFTVWFIK